MWIAYLHMKCFHCSMFRCAHYVFVLFLFVHNCWSMCRKWFRFIYSIYFFAQRYLIEKQNHWHDLCLQVSIGIEELIVSFANHKKNRYVIIIFLFHRVYYCDMLCLFVWWFVYVYFLFNLYIVFIYLMLCQIVWNYNFVFISISVVIVVVDILFIAIVIVSSNFPFEPKLYIVRFQCGILPMKLHDFAYFENFLRIFLPVSSWRSSTYYCRWG